MPVPQYLRQPLHSNLVIFKFNWERHYIILITFTFQSGYIQMWSANVCSLFVIPLHSNLVIFKSYILVSSFRNFTPFTFQSGYIQIIPPTSPPIAPPTLHSNLVIFKWDINNGIKNKGVDLYIPIWLYSNSVIVIDIRWLIKLYIPIWLYSNYGLLHKSIYSFSFTFQSGYIQMKGEPLWNNGESAFTFQSGYIQMLINCYLCL